MSAPDDRSAAPLAVQQTGPAEPSLARRAVGLAATRVVLLVTGTAASVLVSRALGPSGRGQYAFAVAVAATSVALAHASVEHAQVYLSSTGTQVRRLAANAVALALLLGLLTVGAVLAASLLTGYPSHDVFHDGPLLLAVATVPAQILVLYANGLLVLLGRTDLLNRGALLGGVAQCTLLFALAATGRLSVLMVVVSWTLSGVLPLAVSLPFLRPRRADLSFTTARQELATGLRYHGGLASLFLLLRVDVLLLAALTDDRAVGLYALAVGLIELTNVATDAVATAVVQRQTTATLADAALLTARVVGLTLVLALVAATGLSLASPFLVPLVYGGQFRDAVPALLALAPGVLALAASRSAGGYLIRLNRPWTVTGLATGALAVNVAANLVLIPRTGIVGAGLASSAAYTLLAGAYLTWLRRAGDLQVADFAPRLELARLRRARG